MAAPAPAPIAAFSIGGLFAAAPFGVNVTTISLGMLFSITGMFGRFAFDLQKGIESGSRLRLSQTLGWVGAGLIGAPFLSVVWIVFLRSLGAQTDTATAIGLLFLGFTGPKGVTWLMGSVTDFVTQRLASPKVAPKL